MRRYPDVLTTGGVAKICKVSPRTVMKWFDTGRLVGWKMPGSQDRRILLTEVVAFLRRHGMPVPPGAVPLAKIAYGVLASEVPEGWTHCGSVFDLAFATAEAGGIAAVVIGDLDGATEAVRVARQLLARYPGAVVTLVVDGGTVGSVPDGPGRVVMRPADVATVYKGAA